ncbi:MAG: glycoside hydrolase N-terminal domain-containing protein, partial [Thermoguttaceae bacterium]
MTNSMPNRRCLHLFVVTLLVSFVASPLYSQQTQQQPEVRAHSASLSRAPSRWDHALMTGNGSLGAIVMTRLPNETITLCHDQLMLRSQKPNMPDVSHILPEVRKLIAQRKYRDAKGLFEGMIKKTYDYRGPDPFHPAMDITVDQKCIEAAIATDVRRVLDYETGEVTTAWTQGDVRYGRKLFVSRKDNVVVMQLSASKPGSITVKIGLLPTALKREELGDGKNVRVPRFTKEYKAKVILPEVPITFNLAAEGDELLTLLAEYDTGGPHEMIGGEYGTATHIFTKGGAKKVENLQLCVDKADEVMLVQGLFTNEPSTTALPELRKRVAALPKDYDTLLKRHTDVHRELFLRCTVDLDADPEYRAMTNEALFDAVRGKKGYKAMLERMYDAGRFVLMASSSETSNPTHLKAVWTGIYGPGWAADYHNDVNVQMSYWQALPGNMPEVTLGYFQYYDSMVPDFQTAAKRLYGCRGIRAPICMTSNGLPYFWSFSAWTGAAPWLAQLYYDYWLFTGDREFLKGRAVPFMKEVALFYEDFLFEGDDGRLVFSPSYSPENQPKNADSPCVDTTTADVAKSREVLTNLCNACELLGIEKKGVQRWRKLLAKLPEYHVDENNRLTEWLDPELKDNYSHRHLTHIYPLFPGFEATPERTPELYEAARNALLAKGFPSQANFTYPVMAGAYTRMLDGNRAAAALIALVRNGLFRPSMGTQVGQGNRWPVVQFETTMACPSALLDMLFYSDPTLLRILPALPDMLPTGRVDGM